jgi:hypothetical protein
MVNLVGYDGKFFASPLEYLWSGPDDGAFSVVEIYALMLTFKPNSAVYDTWKIRVQLLLWR